MKFKTKKLVMAVSLALACQGASAGEKEELEALRQTTLNLIQALVDQGLLPKKQAEALITRAAINPLTEASSSKTEEGVIRVPYVPESVKKEIREQIKHEVLAQAKNERWGDPGALPDWVGRFKLDGDVRLRYQKDIFQKDNFTPTQLAPFGININNTLEDRERLRLRARLNVKAKVTDDLVAGLRLTTGNTTEPVSTNQTLGTSFNKYSVMFDQVYLKYDPYRWLSASGGRIPNPWFSTDLVWDKDLNFEGVAATLKPRITDNLTGFLTGGAFPLQEIESSDTVKAKSKWLYGVQGGGEWISDNQSKFKVGLAYYQYMNVAGKPNTVLNSTNFNGTAPQFRQKGNSVFNIDNDGNPATNLWALSSNFREINLTASADFAAFDPVHVIVTGDYVKNVGFNRSEILQRTGQDIEPRVKGYQTKVTLGMLDTYKLGDWQAYVGYRHLERDAVLDAFTDSDFHLGGTDTKGYFVGGNYGIGKNAWLSMRYMSADAIDGPPLAIDVLQVDLNAKF